MAMKKRAPLPALMFLTACLVACTTANNLNSTLWMQTAAEYRAVTDTVYTAAIDHLDGALYAPSWTACLEQTGDEYRHLPPAVVLDVDETVLDNTAFEGQLILNDAAFSAGEWDRWISMAAAGAVPGARRFIEAARRRGIAVIYLTNRTCHPRDGSPDRCPQKADTIRNLRALGFPAINPDEEMLLNNERPGWTGEKQSRRVWVAGKYRILMLIGDDLGDFIPGVKGDISPGQRVALTQRHTGAWGTRWFMLPNPAYGSWRQILSPPVTHHLRGYP